MDRVRILLVSANRLDLTPDDLAPLVEDLFDDFSARATGKEIGGYGVTWWEVLLAYVGLKAADTTISNVTESLIDSVKSFVQRRRNEELQKRPRPFSLTIYDEDGRFVKRLEIKSDGEVELFTEPSREEDDHKPPPEAV